MTKTKLTFERLAQDVSEPSKIEMEFTEDYDIYEFKTLCMRMAAAIGYHQNSIERAFGNEDESYYNKNSFNNELDNILGGLFGGE